VQKAEIYTMSQQIVYNTLSRYYQWRLTRQTGANDVMTVLAKMLTCGYIYIYFVCDVTTKPMLSLHFIKIH